MSGTRVNLGLIITVCLAASAAGDKRTAGLPTQEMTKIEAVHQVYSRAWLRNDQAGVLGVFTNDAVIMPHHGDEPRVGVKAIKAFWFPAGSPAAKITKFELKTDEIGGSGEFAYARGHFTLAWTSEVNGITRTTTNAGTYLDILRKQPDGTWKITHHMWDDPVPQMR
jgi:uncharacterized protein (TIGR02246 family)